MNNANTYHFENARLNANAQTRVSSNSETAGFVTLDECKKFLKSISFSYQIVYYDENNKRHLVCNEVHV